MATDKRILNLSYSSRLTLHTCPRKFQLYRLNSKAEDTENPEQTVTFAYGHVVGDGIQNIFQGLSLEQIIWRAFLFWDTDLYATNDKQKKSFWGAIHALRQLYHARQAGFLKDYELVTYDGKPACELTFLIYLPDGFVYRGSVDAVIRNIHTGKVVVLESKTTKDSRINPAQYKNSAQAIGYSIVLDAMFPGLSSYEVYYLIYQTGTEAWTTIPFEKSFFQRALWIRELLLDVEMIKTYEAAQIYPMHGESCYTWFRECEYMQYCTLSNSFLTEPLTEEGAAKIDADLDKHQIKITFQDLIQAQLDKQSDREVSMNPAHAAPYGDEFV